MSTSAPQDESTLLRLDVDFATLFLFAPEEGGRLMRGLMAACMSSRVVKITMEGGSDDAGNFSRSMAIEHRAFKEGLPENVKIRGAEFVDKIRDLERRMQQAIVDGRERRREAEKLTS